MTNPVDIAESQRQINAAREQTHANIATSQGWAEIASEGAEIATEKSAQAVSAASTAVASKDAALDYRNQSQVFAQTLNQRVDTGGQEIGYTSDGRPYLLDQAVNIPLRVDNSVGTRVFLGNTMIHGDTGWRNVTALLFNDVLEASDSTMRVSLRRCNDTIHLAYRMRVKTSSSHDFLELPVGFVPQLPYRALAGTTSGGGLIGTFGFPNRLRFTPSPAVGTLVSGHISVSVSSAAAHNWPSALPGSPE